MKPKHILVIDDQEDQRYLYKQVLKSSKFKLKVQTVKNGFDALIYLETHTPDVIITDLMMPEMNGLDVVLEIKKNRLLNIPIIMTTAHVPDTVCVDAAKSLGTHEFLQSDHIFTKLIPTVESQLQAQAV